MSEPESDVVWLIDASKNLLLKKPFTMIVAGSTGSGKSCFVQKLILNLHELSVPDNDDSNKVKMSNVLWVYGIWQKEYSENKRSKHCTVSYSPDLPESIENIDVIVIDDKMADSSIDQRMIQLFTRESHHKNVSVIFIIQNIFHQSKYMRSVTLNSHYIVLFKSRRDLTQVDVLGRQLFGKSTWFRKVYKEAVLDRDYSYLLIDLTPTTEERNRIRSSILPDEFPIEIFDPDE